MSDEDELSDSIDGWGQPSRSKRLKGEELRVRVLDTAEELLSETGLTVSLDHLNMEELIRRVGVPRTSTFNEFGGKEGLITALILKMIRPDESQGAAFSPATLEIAQKVLSENQHRLVDQAGCDAVLREAIRLGAKQNYDDIIASSYWKTYMALSVSLAGLPADRRDQVLSMLRVVEERFIELMSSFYTRMLPILRRRIRDGLDARQIAAAGSAVVEGIAERRFVNPELVDTPIWQAGLDGELVEWHLAAIGFLSIIEGMTEPME